MSLAEVCGRFCNTSLPKEEHEVAVVAVAAGGWTLVEVVEALGPALTDKNPLSRSRGVLLLAVLLQRLPLHSVLPGQIEFLVAFFRDRSRDSPCVPEVVMALTALLERWQVADAQVETLLTSIFTEVFVQSLDQAGRLAMYRLMALVLDRNVAAAVGMRHDFVYGYLQMIDGERDPRNLIMIFDLTPKVIKVVPGWERFSDELFDVTSCYYPVNFKGGSNGTITTDMIRDALDRALLCTPRWAPLLYGLLEEKMVVEGGGPPPSGLWQTVARSVELLGDGGAAFRPHASALWGGIQAAATGEGAEEALAGAEMIARALARDAITDSDGRSSLESGLHPLLEGCVAWLKEGGARSQVSGALLARVSRASGDAARLVGNVAIIPLVSREGDALAAEQLSLLISAATAASEAGSEGKKHPFWGHAESIAGVIDKLKASGQVAAARSLRREASLRAGLFGVDSQRQTLLEEFESSSEEAVVLAMGSLSEDAQRGMGAEVLTRVLLGGGRMAQIALAALAGLRPGVVLSGEAVRAALKEGSCASGWGGAGLASLACHGHLTLPLPDIIAALGPPQLGWVAQGFCAGRRSTEAIALIDSLLLLESSGHPDAAAGLARALAAPSSPPSPHILHLSSAGMSSLLRQRLLYHALPVLLERRALPALGAVCTAVPSATLLGYAPTLTPMLLMAVASAAEAKGVDGEQIKDDDASRAAAAAGALRTLAALVIDGGSDLSLHTDTLLPRAASICASHRGVLREAALQFLLAAAKGLPFPRLFAWKEKVLQCVSIALDDPRRAVRHLATQVSNTYHTLN